MNPKSNSQKSEFEKNFFLHDLGRLCMRTKSVSKHLDSYFGFGSEKSKEIYEYAFTEYL